MSIKQTIYNFYEAKEDQDDLANLCEEIALAADKPAAAGLIALAGIYIENENIKKAKDVLEKLKTPEIQTPANFFESGSFLDIGRLLLKQVISGQPNIDLELLKKVIYFLEKSKTTEAQYIIGVFYYECFHDYKKAYECFLKSSGDFPSAKVSIAEIIRNGLHEEKPDIDKALEIYLALENECILNPSSKEHTDILPTVLNNIGSIYLCMKDEVLAIIYYERSGNDMARNSLANILWKQGKKEQSMEIFKNLKTIDGQLNYFMKCGVMGTLTKEQINSKIRSLIGPECSAENLGQILITLYINGYEDKKFLLEKSREFNKASETMHELDRIFIQAWLAYAEGNYMQGHLYASKLILNNVYGAENILVLLEKKLREEGNADISSSEESEDISSGDSELEESPPNLKKPSDGDHEKQEEKTLESCLIESPNEGTFSINNNDGKSEETFSSSPSSSEKKLSSERRREKQEKRIKKESEKNKRKALKLMELYLSSSSSSSAFDKTTQQEIRYSFNNNKKLEEEFNRLIALS